MNRMYTGWGFKAWAVFIEEIFLTFIFGQVSDGLYRRMSPSARLLTDTMYVCSQIAWVIVIFSAVTLVVLGTI